MHVQVHTLSRIHYSLQSSQCIRMRSCSVNLSQLSEGEVHDLMLNVTAKGGGDSEGGGGEVLGTIQCLLQISSTNVEEESEENPVDMQLVSKRYVSLC